VAHLWRICCGQGSLPTGSVICDIIQLPTRLWTFNPPAFNIVSGKSPDAVLPSFVTKGAGVIHQPLGPTVEPEHAGCCITSSAPHGPPKVMVSAVTAWSTPVTGKQLIGTVSNIL
jgi:hypothetical protein